MATVLITGGTGVVGKHLSKKLKEKGYTVTVLSRTSSNYDGLLVYSWNIDINEINKEALETADYIIHLAGANIGDRRWTAKRRQIIINSRVKSAQLIFDNIKENKNRLKAFISASAIGYYGSITNDRIYSETDPAFNDFLGDTCLKWEQSADKFEDLGIRTVKIRTGVVLAKQGGVLPKMILPVKIGIGCAIGNGRQYIPWIHIEDLCDIYIKAIEDIQMRGAYNAVSPDHKTNRCFIKTLARLLKKPFMSFKIPAFIIKIIFGNMSTILLRGSRVSSEKISKAGYSFKFTSLENALSNLLDTKQKAP